MKRTVIGAVTALLLISPLVNAEQQSAIAFSAGAFEAFENDGSAAEIGIEYRFSPRESLFNLIPTLGLAMNSDGGYWGYAGIRYDWMFSAQWTLTPHFAIAAYEDGGGTDLGHDMEFRTGLDLGYQLTDSSRLALGIYHMSNADVADDNPGSESVIVTYSVGF